MFSGIFWSAVYIVTVTNVTLIAFRSLLITDVVYFLYLRILIENFDMIMYVVLRSLYVFTHNLSGLKK